MTLDGHPPTPQADINTRMMSSPELPLPMIYMHGNPGDPAADLLVMASLMMGLPEYRAHPVTGNVVLDNALPGWEVRLGATTLDVYARGVPGVHTEPQPLQEGIRLTSAPPAWEEELRTKLAAILVVGPPLPFHADRFNDAPLMMLRGRQACIGAVHVRVV